MIHNIILSATVETLYSDFDIEIEEHERIRTDPLYRITLHVYEAGSVKTYAVEGTDGSITLQPASEFDRALAADLSVAHERDQQRRHEE